MVVWRALGAYGGWIMQDDVREHLAGKEVL
jgi:hypothetical protein